MGAGGGVDSIVWNGVIRYGMGNYGMVQNYTVWYGDTSYDRGGTFPLNCFLDDGVPVTKNRRNPNLASKNDVIVYLGHGIIHAI